MKRWIAFVLICSCVVTLFGCGVAEPQVTVPSGWSSNGGVYINVDGKTLYYERVEGGSYTNFDGGMQYYKGIQREPWDIGLTLKEELDQFVQVTHIEGIIWQAYSVEEYPDLSYILLISGTWLVWKCQRAEMPEVSNTEES